MAAAASGCGSDAPSSKAYSGAMHMARASAAFERRSYLGACPDDGGGACTDAGSGTLSADGLIPACTYALVVARHHDLGEDLAMLDAFIVDDAESVPPSVQPSPRQLARGTRGGAVSHPSLYLGPRPA
jgi:hypothetical protein